MRLRPERPLADDCREAAVTQPPCHQVVLAVLSAITILNGAVHHAAAAGDGPLDDVEYAHEGALDEFRRAATVEKGVHDILLRILQLPPLDLRHHLPA